MKRRVQFDSNSCGVSFVAGIASYVNALPLSSGLDDAFDIAYNSVERKAEIQLICLYLHHQIGNSKIISIIFTAHFLVHALMEDQLLSEFYLEGAQKEFAQPVCISPM